MGTIGTHGFEMECPEEGDHISIIDGTVRVMVDDRDIRENGWIREDEQTCMSAHCEDDSCNCEPDVTPALDVLERWHNAVHIGTVRFCDQSPCADFREADLSR